MMKKIVIGMTLLLGLLAVWIYGEKKGAQAVSPSGGQTNLIVFLQARPPNLIRKFVYNGQLYMEVIGKPNVSPLSVPSGSPAYIFDETGVLVDWSRDLGDAPSFVKKWGGFSNAAPISVQEAAELVKAH